MRVAQDHLRSMKRRTLYRCMYNPNGEFSLERLYQRRSRLLEKSIRRSTHDLSRRAVPCAGWNNLSLRSKQSTRRTDCNSATVGKVIELDSELFS